MMADSKLVSLNNNLSGKIKDQGKVIKNYYGTMDIKKINDGLLDSKILGAFNTVIALLGSIIIIVMNIMIIQNYTRTTDNQALIKESLQSVQQQIKALTDKIGTEIGPKVSLIDTSSTITIPANIGLLGSKISQSTSSINENVNDKCKFTLPPLKIHECNISCPNPLPFREYRPISQGVSDLVGLPNQICLQKTTSTILKPRLISYTLPINTREGVCITDPLLAVDNGFFAYSHLEKIGSCTRGIAKQRIIGVGEVLDRGDKVPSMFMTNVWTPPNPSTIHHCSSTYHEDFYYTLCAVSHVGDPILNSTSWTESLSLIRLAVRPKSDSGDYNQKYIAITKVERGKYDKVMPYGPSGIKQGDTLYFPAVGFLPRTEFQYNDSNCPIIHCKYSKAENCRLSMGVNSKSHYILRSGLLKYNLSLGGDITLQFIEIADNRLTIGSPSKIYNSLGQPVFYQASYSWDTMIKLGDVDTVDPLRVQWRNNSVISRPGQSQCPRFNVCPEVCWEGTYNDAFLIDRLNWVSAGVYLNSNQTAENPVFAVFKDNEILYQVPLAEDDTNAQKTITDCFLLENVIWCISLVEIYDTGDSVIRPKLFAVKIPAQCSES
uniref:Attachment glycoprotein n=1 Tax=Henipavirus hendraense TaxID=3052223 RepID=F4YH98_9MONO|nr:attachment glycoprotein [Henipavirus hendraense]AEQ38124.1 attachment glycoprotein [Henipavirus hendraense]